MLYYDGTVVFERIDVNRRSESKEHNICYYWYFLNSGFKFQPNVSHRCHDLLMIHTSISNIAILNIKSVDYHCIISGITKNETIHFMQNTDLTSKSEPL